MLGFFDDPFLTNDSHRLLNYLINDYMDVEDNDDDKKKQVCKCNNDIFNWKPRSDIHETETSYVIDAELPGVPKDAINIQIKDDILTISGKKETKKEWEEGEKKEEEKKEEKKEGEKKEEKKETKKPVCHYMERSYGSFQRSYALPEHVDPASITAACNDGVLTITIPKVKKEEPKIQKITIQ